MSQKEDGYHLTATRAYHLQDGREQRSLWSAAQRLKSAGIKHRWGGKNHVVCDAMKDEVDLAIGNDNQFYEWKKKAGGK